MAPLKRSSVADPTKGYASNALGMLVPVRSLTPFLLRPLVCSGSTEGAETTGEGRLNKQNVT